MTEPEKAPPVTVTRRGVIAGAAAIGVGSALVACGADTPSQPAAATTPTTVPVSDVPVGGGVVAGSVVVAQPTAGQYTAFSATCTHQNCLVSRVESANIHCTCHGSVFSATDGSVITGPATRRLDPRTVTVDGATLRVT